MCKLNKHTKIVLLSLAIAFISNLIKAQNVIPDSLNIIILKNYKPKVNDATKLSISPENPIEPASKPRLEYSVISKQFATGFDPEPITPAKVQAESVKKLGFGYMKAGFGNYTSPLGELYFANKRSKTFNYGVGLKHLSSLGQLKNTWFSGFSDNNADAWGKYFVGKLILDANVKYDRNMLRFYGFSPPDSIEINKTDFKNLLQHVEASIGLGESRVNSNSLFDGARVTYHHFRTNRMALENNLLINGGLKYIFKKSKTPKNELPPSPLSSSETLRLGYSVDYYQLQVSPIGINQSNTIINLNPSFVKNEEKWGVELGGSIVWDIKQNSTINYLYPQAKVRFSIVDDLLEIYAGVKGGLQRNSLRYLCELNPFYNVYSDTASFNLNTNTSTTYDAYGGLNGKLSNNTSFKVEMHGQGVRSLPMFVNDFSDGKGNTFNVIYDNGTILNPHAEFGFQQKEKLSIFFKFDYFHYLLQNEVKPWLRPNVNTTLSANYNISEKFIIKFDVYYISRQFARTLDKTGVIIPIRLKGIADINLGVEYRFNKKFGAFVMFNNIAAYRYQRWYQYPTQRFNFMLGVTANF